MSLASLIREQMVPVVKCRTCIMLSKVTDQDRADFEAAREDVPASVLAKALTARLHELGLNESVGDSSTRTHIRERHGL